MQDLDIRNRSIAILDTASRVDGRENLSFNEKIELVTYNTGNRAFFQGLRAQFPQAAVKTEWEQLGQDVDTVILSMANFINPFSELTDPLKAVENCGSRGVVLIGAGAQAQNYDSTFELRSDTRQFLDAILRRSESIGVRGEYTAELLRRNRYDRVRVIGCPSIYGSGLMPPEISGSLGAGRLAIGFTPSGHHREAIRTLYAYAVRHDATYVLQSELHLRRLFENDESDSEALEKLSFFINYYAPNALGDGVFETWLRKRGEFFFHPDPWIARMRECDLYVGGRIHGSILALKAGRRALTLVCDTRTRELCEHFNLPFIDIGAFDPDRDLNYYFELADPANFLATYRTRLDEYVRFLEENGLHSPLLADQRPAALQQQPEAAVPTERLDGLGIGEAVRLRRLVRMLGDAATTPGLNRTRAAAEYLTPNPPALSA